MRIAAILLATFLALSGTAGAETLEDAIATLAQKISSSAQEQKKRKIAVLPFDEAEGRKTVLATYVPETLVTNLFQLGRYEIVERQLLEKVIGELRMQNREGAFDPKTAAQVGQIAGVEAIVTGTITEFPEYIAINCRIIDTTTATVFGAAATKFAKDANLKALMKGGGGAATAEQDADSQKAQTERPSFTSNHVRVEVTTAERRASSVVLSLTVESRNPEPYYFGTGSVYMLDDEGERWGCVFDDGYDSASFQLHPRTRRKLRLTCRPGGDAHGKTFTLIGAGGNLGSIEDIVPAMKK
ncbi:MAG TPA: FlgO family outer membrane protein [Thermoanaerobaculia bacterium]|nr:FlgO family outer membrane protein [Thermoanaerobaculia bacterium]